MSLCDEDHTCPPRSIRTRQNKTQPTSVHWLKTSTSMCGMQWNANAVRCKVTHEMRCGRTGYSLSFACVWSLSSERDDQRKEVDMISFTTTGRILRLHLHIYFHTCIWYPRYMIYTANGWVKLHTNAAIPPGVRVWEFFVASPLLLHYIFHPNQQNKMSRR